MIILFLDIDGVLNSADWYERREAKDERPRHEFDPLCVARLSRFLQEAPDVQVVISSCMRKIYKVGLLTKYMVWAGLDPEVRYRFIGSTPSHPSGFRGHEIAEWMEGKDIEKFAMLDDSQDFREDQLPFLVKPSHWHGGMQDEHVERLKEILT